MNSATARPGTALAVLGVIGGSEGAADGFLAAMRLSCRGVRTVNLGTGVSLERAATVLARRPDAQALLLVAGAPGPALVRGLVDLPWLLATGGLNRPVIVGGSPGSGGTEGSRSGDPGATTAGRLLGLGVTQVLPDLADAAQLLLSRAGPPGAAPSGEKPDDRYSHTRG
ncbi:hypothetical protein [Streptomyces triticagri]|nr:hypothetical protein [Streptomyces triticagri]